MKRVNQQGAVSIISVVIFITIITIIVSAYLVSALSQQRTAANFDMSTRAYYAAESGIQDALRELQKNPASIIEKTDCKPFIGGSGTGDLGSVDIALSYTCQLIDTSPKAITGSVEPQETTAMFRLVPKSAANNLAGNNFKLRLSWSMPPVPSEGGLDPVEPLVARSNDAKDLPSITQWKDANDNRYHAMIRLNVLSHPLGNSLNINDVTQNVSFLNPTNAEDELTFTKAGTLAQDKVLSNAQCANSGEYLCKKDINLNGYDFTSDAVYVRIGALYGKTDFQLELIDNTGRSVELVSAQATVDVTGKAKDVYRRVRQAFPLSGGYVLDDEPDAALISGEGICKYFSVTNNPADFKSKCDPTNP